MSSENWVYSSMSYKSVHSIRREHVFNIRSLMNVVELLTLKRETSKSINTQCSFSCCLISVQLSSSLVPRSSRVDSQSLRWIRPWMVERWERPPNLYQHSTPVEGISCFQLPTENSWNVYTKTRWKTKQTPSPTLPWSLDNDTRYPN